MRSLSIVHTEASTGWGGQEIRILNEALGLMARGHHLTLLCPREAQIFDAARARGLPVEALPIGRKKLSGAGALRTWLTTHPVDVVNCHSSTDTWLTALASLTMGRPPVLVRTRHISAPVSRDRWTRWLYQRATRAVVTTGEALRRQLIDGNGFDPDRLVSIPTGIDTARFVPGDRDAARTALDLPRDVRIIGILATLRDWKGHHHLIDAFATLTDPDLRLLIVGDGPRRTILEAQIARLGLSQRVLMPGNRDDVVPWLQAMDVFALPSYANEGVPQALLQAMACGLPIVTTPVGAILEAAQDMETALVVAARNPAAVAGALSRLLGDAALARRLGAAARDRAVRSFGIDTMLDRMERLFDSVAQGRPIETGPVAGAQA